MKNQLTKILYFFIITVVLLTSCSTSQGNQELPPEVYETQIAYQQIIDEENLSRELQLIKIKKIVDIVLNFLLVGTIIILIIVSVFIIWVLLDVYRQRELAKLDESRPVIDIQPTELEIKIPQEKTKLKEVSPNKYKTILDEIETKLLVGKK